MQVVSNARSRKRGLCTIDKKTSGLHEMFRQLLKCHCRSIIIRGILAAVLWFRV